MKAGGYLNFLLFSFFAYILIYSLYLGISDKNIFFIFAVSIKEMKNAKQSEKKWEEW
jgi:hypothetical protein